MLRRFYDCVTTGQLFRVWLRRRVTWNSDMANFLSFFLPSSIFVFLRSPRLRSFWESLDSTYKDEESMAGSAVSSLGIPSRPPFGGACLLLDAKLAIRSAAKWPPLIIAAAIQFCPTASLLSLNSLIAWLLNCSQAFRKFPRQSWEYCETGWDRLSAFFG